ncbi:At2g23090 like protein [Xylaria palmicola]|nr:At2g23090 like protein [Xylaria palmicola]
MGNGAKAQQKRERNAKDANKGAKSQLKTNQKAMDIQCAICKSTFLKTTRAPQYVFPYPLPDAPGPPQYTTPPPRDGRRPVCMSLRLPLFRLTEHAVNKHSKALLECFPGYEIA